MTASDYRQLFKYEFWANRLVAEALSDNMSSALRLFGHIMASQRLWLDRLTDNPQSMPVWPTLTVDECHALLERLEMDWSNFLDDLSDDALDRAFSYVNSKGVPWTSIVADTLTHLITHSCYHRGQIALTIRHGGDDPPYTDFIQATRQGLI